MALSFTYEFLFPPCCNQPTTDLATSGILKSREVGSAFHCYQPSNYLTGLTLLLCLDIVRLVCLRGLPGLHLFVCFFLRNAIPFLYLAHQLISLAADDR